MANDYEAIFDFYTARLAVSYVFFYISNSGFSVFSASYPRLPPKVRHNSADQ